MTMTLAENIIRLTGLPAYCSACMNQDSQVRHVDCDAAIDRGYGTGPVPIAMDDLVLCENCISEAARLIGMVHADDQAARIEALERQVGQERYRADSNEEYAAKLELAMDSRPVSVSAPRRRGRPPKSEE